MKALTTALAGAAIAALGASLAGPDQAGAQARKAARDCFSANAVNGFNPVDDDTVDIRVGANRRYRLELAGFCPDIDRSWRIAVRTTGGSSWICQGLDAELIVPSPSGRQRCLVTDVRRLSEDEVRAARRRR